MFRKKSQPFIIKSTYHSLILSSLHIYSIILHSGKIVTQIDFFILLSCKVKPCFCVFFKKMKSLFCLSHRSSGTTVVQLFLY